MLELINEKRSEYLASEGPHLYVEDYMPLPYPAHAPPPSPPLVSKYQLYGDPAEFEHVDEVAISVSAEFLDNEKKMKFLFWQIEIESKKLIFFFFLKNIFF